MLRCRIAVGVTAEVRDGDGERPRTGDVGIRTWRIVGFLYALAMRPPGPMLSDAPELALDKRIL
jgi:hypothetical protein